MYSCTSSRPYSSIILPMRSVPRRLAAICACKSDSTVRVSNDACRDQSASESWSPCAFAARDNRAHTVSQRPRAHAARVLGGLLDEVVQKRLAVELALDDQLPSSSGPTNLLDDLAGDDLRAFLEDGLRRRRHRSRKDAADVGVMPARGREEDDLSVAKHGRDGCAIFALRLGDVRKLTW